MKLSARAVAGLLGVAALGSGCAAHTTTGAPQAEDGSATATSSPPIRNQWELDCKAVQSPLADIEPLGPDEPRMRIPLPPGWRPTTKMNGEVVRFAAANADLATGGFAPNVVVTLEKLPAGTTERSAFDQQIAALSAAGVQEAEVKPGVVCGQAATRLDYLTGPAAGMRSHPARVLIPFFPGDDAPYVASVTVQGMDPADQTYRRDATEILDGFQILPPE